VASVERAGRLPLGAEIVLSLGAGAAAFALAAVALASSDSGFVAAVLGVVYLVAVIVLARFASIAHAVPVGLAGMTGFISPRPTRSSSRTPPTWWISSSTSD
jgi:hypothetical protein